MSFALVAAILLGAIIGRLDVYFKKPQAYCILSMTKTSERTSERMKEAKYLEIFLISSLSLFLYAYIQIVKTQKHTRSLALSHRIAQWQKFHLFVGLEQALKENHYDFSFRANDDDYSKKFFFCVFVIAQG